MADEKVLIEIEVDNQQALRDLDRQNLEIKELEESQKKLAASSGKNTAQYQKQATQLKKLRSERNQNLKAISSERGSLNELRANLANLTRQRNAVNVSTKQGAAEFRRLNKEINAQSKSIKRAEQAGNDFRRNVGNYGDTLGQVSPRIGGVVTQFQALTRASLAFIATPIGAVIAALGVAIGALTQFFRDNVDGQNKLLSITNTLSAAWGVFTDIISDFGKTVFEAIENPTQAFKDLGNVILNNLINRWQGFVNLISSGGNIVVSAFEALAAQVKIALADVPIIGKAIDLDQATKDYQKATNDLKTSTVDFANAAVQAISGIEDPLQTGINLYDRLNENLERSNALTKTQIDLRAQERTIQSETAKLQVEIAELRLKAKKEDEFTAAERIAFLEEAKKLTDEQFALEENLARLKFEAKQQENQLSNSTQEDLVEENRLLAELILKEQARLNANRKLETEIQTNIKKRDAEFRNSELEKQEAVRKSEEEIRKNRKITFDLEVKQIEKARAQRAKAINFGNGLLQNAFSIAQNLAGQDEQRQKTISRIQAITNTAVGITKAFATLGPIAGIPAAATVAASGAAQLVAINNSSSGGSVSAPSGGGASSNPTINTSPQDQAFQQQQALTAALDNLGLTVSVTEINDAQSAVQVADQTATI